MLFKNKLNTKILCFLFRFIKSRNTERNSFESAINKTVKVKVTWEAHPNDEVDDVYEEDSVYGDDQASITFEYNGSESDWKKSAIWKDITKKAVSDYFVKSIYHIDFSVEGESRDDILDKLETLKKRHSFEYEYNDSMEITLYGSNEAVLKEVAEKAGQKVVIPEIVTESVEIAVKQYFALEAEGILNKVKIDCSETSFKVNAGTNVITLEGPKDEVKIAHRNILNFALNLKSVELPISKEIVMFLRKGGIEVLKDQFCKEGINPDISLSEKAVNVMTYIENENIEKKRETMSAIIRKFINKCTIRVDKEPHTTFTTGEWKHCKDDIDRKTNGLVVILGPTSKQITIIGTEETVKVAKTDIESYLKSHKLGSVLIHVPVEIAEYLDEFRSDDVRDKIECVKDSLGFYTGKLSLKCPTDDINRVQKVVEKEIKEIKQHWFVMKEKWIANVILDLVDLKTLSQNERFLLQVDIGHTLAAQGIMGISVFSKSGTIIQVKRGDITIETTSAIVHSTNGNDNAFENGMGKILQSIGKHSASILLLNTCMYMTVGAQ